jgi:hypothetical protein
MIDHYIARGAVAIGHTADNGLMTNIGQSRHKISLFCKQ